MERRKEQASKKIRQERGRSEKRVKVFWKIESAGFGSVGRSGEGKHRCTHIWREREREREGGTSLDGLVKLKYKTCEYC